MCQMPNVSAFVFFFQHKNIQKLFDTEKDYLLSANIFQHFMKLHGITKFNTIHLALI